MNYETEILGDDEDDGTMRDNVLTLADAVAGHKIVSAGKEEVEGRWESAMGDVLELTVGWSCGNPFYYGYGFSIRVTDIS